MAGAQIARAEKESDKYETPDWLFNRLNRVFRITLDAAANWYNAKCDLYYTIDDDGLVQPWAPHVVFVNPPYSGRQIDDWIAKAWSEYQAGATIVALLPVSPSAEWWQLYAVHGQIFFFRNRIKFSNTKSGGTRDSALIVFADKEWYPTGETAEDAAARVAWHNEWGDIMYPAADLR